MPEVASHPKVGLSQLLKVHSSWTVLVIFIIYDSSGARFYIPQIIHMFLCYGKNL